MSDEHQSDEPQFYEGGIVPGGRGEVLAVLHKGEEILSLSDPRQRDDQEPA